MPATALAKKHRSAITLLVVLALLVVRITGLHFHVDQSADWHESSAAATVHAEHSDTHAAHHEKTGGIDFSTIAFWKKLDQGSNILALLTIAFIVLLPAMARGIGRISISDAFSLRQPVFLRPPLRAPPL